MDIFFLIYTYHLVQINLIYSILITFQTFILDFYKGICLFFTVSLEPHNKFIVLTTQSEHYKKLIVFSN